LVRVLTELKAVRTSKRVVVQAALTPHPTKWADYTVAVAAVIQVLFPVLGAMAVRGLLESYSDPEELFLVQTQI
tara:strand:+ start:946 stop:1167 length:222 start_codon:yes stop_codon:yes gene_type:complete